MQMVMKLGMELLITQETFSSERKQELDKKIIIV
uniref:Uncharacterized protein n=1 Tax=Synechococcus phage S-SCSM1 TaxID=2588487 RepID=A0A6M2ZHJ1_9CAUD